MRDLLDQDGIENGQTPEEACKSRILDRAFRSGIPSVENDPEYKRLFKYFHGNDEEEGL